MNRTIAATSLAILSSLSVGSSALAGDLQRVPRILKIVCSIEKSKPPNLKVSVTGEVNTAGWTEPSLMRRVYVANPVDGIWEYDLFARSPDGIVSQVLTAVEADNSWPGYPEKGVAGIRVYGDGEGIKKVSLKECTSASAP